MKKCILYTTVKKPTITEAIRLYRLCSFGHVQRMQENRIPKRVLQCSLDLPTPHNTFFGIHRSPS
jgi:hypothetical protein